MVVVVVKSPKNLSGILQKNKAGEITDSIVTPKWSPEILNKWAHNLGRESWFGSGDLFL